MATPTEFQGKKLYPFQRQAIEAIDAGRSVVVAAPTGAGKTSIISLLSRLWEVEQGEVMIDGRSVSSGTGFLSRRTP